jgi:Glutamyl-tRNAGlu reductase, N-terminal domain
MHLNTCQRRVSIAASATAIDSTLDSMPSDGALQRLVGVDAYSFLLRLACGLESKMLAETQIFGQIKQAWQTYCKTHPSSGKQLSPVVQKLFQDTKDIRSRFLCNVGSSCYGSEVRRQLGATESAGPALLVGAGQLAQSVAPWIDCSELWICNRNSAAAHNLARQLRARYPERACRVLDNSLESEQSAWASASNIVVCVPVNSERDAVRVAAWSARKAPGKLIHLGADARDVSSWSRLSGFTSLQEIFDRLQSQANQKQRQIQRASHACAEKALLLALSSHATHTHSWEDLAAFALQY